MPKKVDHEQRKELILDAALDVFAHVGYKDTTLSLIAEEAGIPRTVVYQYFHDKNAVLYSVVRTETAKLFVEFSDIAFAEGPATEADRLLSIYSQILDTAVSNEDSMTNLIKLMIDARLSGTDLAAAVKKRTIKLLILVKRLLRKGINSGTFKQSLNVEVVSDSFFSMAEMVCFSVAVYGSVDKEVYRRRFASYLDSIKA